jgi:hypothetical protein
MHGCSSSGAVFCIDSPILECTADAGCCLRRLLLNRVQWPVLDEWQGETRLRFKTSRSVCTAVREMLYADAHQMHAAVDLGGNESAQI